MSGTLSTVSVRSGMTEIEHELGMSRRKARTYKPLGLSPFQKMVKQEVYNLYYHMAVNDIPEEFVESDTIFFLRETAETVSEPNDLAEANDVLPEVLEYGILNHNTLLMLKQILALVYLPAMSHNQYGLDEISAHAESEKAEGEDLQLAQKTLKKPLVFDSYQNLRNEFLMNMQKFLSHIQRTIQQIEGEIKLDMPTLSIEGDAYELAGDQEVVETLENLANGWLVLISSANEELQRKVPQGNGPLAEIDLWRERNATLSALTEQVKLPAVKKVLQVLEIANTGIVDNLQVVVAELSKHHVEAVDNVRFLSTLERHLKNLTHGTGFNVVLDTIPSLMNALRMVWIISRHYNKDERMVPLMERIAWEISAAKVCCSKDRHLAKIKMVEAKRTLEIWKESYFDIRAKIEASGRDARWEFDRKRLFEKTDYMAFICQDLYNVLQRIDEVLYRVDCLVSPMEALTFDPFNLRSVNQWKAVMDEFKLEVVDIEKEAKNFIDESFKTLRSAEAAFDMLLNFKHIRSREAINKQMMMKFNDILAQYCKELEIVNGIFVNNLTSPPLCKNHPPMAGAIYWARSLFYRIKHTIIRFQEVKQKYLEVAKRMKEYEDVKYDQWRNTTEERLPILLKKTLLARVHLTGMVLQSSPDAPEPSVRSDEVETTSEKSTRFVVNFSPILREIINETKYMEHLGFPVPEIARNVALQEDKFLR
ncbi:hypothetical protein E2320_012502 [Naja naja]|nr:hypothetical protein E2320_012502 [Naja naja]